MARIVLEGTAALRRHHGAGTDSDPRPSRHGGHTPTPTPPSTPLASEFDWYQATIEGVDDGRVHAALALSLGGQVATTKGRNGYALGWTVSRGDDVLATVYGHSSREGEVHVVMTGSACPRGVPTIRSLYPKHRVSRADSAVDFTASFDALDREAVAFAEGHGLKHSIIRDSDGGATRRLGSPSSEVFVRLYKKSEQLRALHPDRADEVPDGIVRAELVCRPGKRETKEAVAVMPSDDLWGMGAWTREYAIAVLGFDAARTPTHFRRPSDWSRAVHFLGVQYGPMIAKRAQDVGLASARSEVLRALGLS